MIFWRWLELFLFFLKEVVLANIQVAQLLFRGAEQVKPALIEVPLRISSSRDIYLLSSMITLTPGTLSVEVNEDRNSLLVHVINTEDANEVLKSIQIGFEDRLLFISGVRKAK
jgi:multicomponent Na+:H+ antiporter subunit E